MNNVKHRYSAEIQRTKGLLEVAAALYDTSLSFQTTRAAEQAIQTESRVGYSLTLALTATRESGVSFSFAADGFRELQAVGGAGFRLPGSIFPLPQPWPSGEKAYSPDDSRSGPSRYFLPTTSWRLPSTSLRESRRSHRLAKSVFRFVSLRALSPRHGSNIARRCLL